MHKNEKNPLTNTQLLVVYAAVYLSILGTAAFILWVAVSLFNLRPETYRVLVIIATIQGWVTIKKYLKERT